MLLNLLALLILLALITAGVAMIIRALLEPAPGANTRCAACGRDAADLTDFTCPGCGRDVRDAGLTSTPLDSASARFWRAGTITVVVVSLALFVVALLAHSRSPRSFYMSSARLHAERTPTVIREIELEFNPIFRYGEVATMTGRLVADLTLTDGRMTALEVDVPQHIARAVDEAGNVKTYSAFDEAAVRDWLQTSGVDTTADDAGWAIHDLHYRMRAMIDPQLVARDEQWRGDPKHWSRSTWAGGRTGGRYAVPPPAPSTWAVAWLLSAVTWLVALRRWLRHPRLRRRPDHPRPQQGDAVVRA
jgi:hypothetical protein